MIFLLLGEQGGQCTPEPCRQMGHILVVSGIFGILSIARSKVVSGEQAAFTLPWISHLTVHTAFLQQAYACFVHVSLHLWGDL